MASNALIGISAPNGETATMYCHFDGYPSHLGRVLLDGWNSEKLAFDLITEGNARSLDVDSKKCTFFGRDLGEEWMTSCFLVYKTPEDAEWQNYRWHYLWRDGKWWFKDMTRRTWVALSPEEIIMYVVEG